MPSTTKQQSKVKLIEAIPRFFEGRMFRFLLAFLFFGHMAADGLSDLKAALARYGAKSTIRGTFEAQAWSQQGKDKDATQTRGRAQASVEYGPQGLRMFWDRPLLQQLDRETRARSRPNPPTNQALNALWSMDMRSAAGMVNPVEELSRVLDTATFINEGSEPFNGRQARALNFTAPLGSEAQRLRRWLKDYSSTIVVWIDGNGSPLGISRKVIMKARAFLVISLEQTREEAITYATAGDHLICARQEEKQEFQGGGEYGTSRTIRTFTIN
jgi:hypothetical protein